MVRIRTQQAQERWTAEKRGQDLTDPKIEGKPERRQLFTRTHHKRSLSRWIVPLAIILVVIFFLPRIMDLLVPS